MKEKKDVLFLCQYFYPEYVSSATLPYDTAKALVKSGFSVSVLCGYPNEYNKSAGIPGKEIHEGIEIKRLKYLQLGRGNFFGRLINYFSFTMAVFLRFISLKNYKSIIVYSNPPVLPIIAAWVSKCFGTKIIFVSYDVYPEIAYATKSISKGGMISKLMDVVNKEIYRDISKVVVLSSEMRDYLLKHRKQLDMKQVEIIPNWYEDKLIENVSKSYLNKKFSNLNPKENLIVSYFGNMGICQDLDTLIDAIRILKKDDEIKFLFAGHGNKLESLKKIIEEENLCNAVVYDFLHGEEFQDGLNISDCFVVSLADGLNGLAVPSKTYSYMMAGKPIISIMDVTMDISKSLLESNAGYAMRVGETEKLVDSIKELKNNESLRIEMGHSVKKIFKENYTTEKGTAKYVEMMKKILKEN